MIDKIKSLKYLIDLLRLCFSKFGILYVLIFISLLSIVVELFAFSILGVISSNGNKHILPLLNNLNNNDLFILFLSLLIFRFITLYFVETYTVEYAKRIQVYLSTSVIKKVFNLNIKDVERNNIGYYTSMGGDESSLASQVLVSFIYIVNTVFLSLLYFTLLIFYSTKLLILLVIVIFISIALILNVYKKIYQIGTTQVELRRDTNSLFIEIFNGLRVIKSFFIQDTVYNNYLKISDTYFSSNSNLFKYNNQIKYIPLVVLLFSFFIFSYTESHLEIAFLFMLLVMELRLLQSLGQLASYSGKLVGDIKSIKKLMDFLNQEIPLTKKEKIEEQIEFIKLLNISFSYQDNKVLNNFSYKFERGKSYAIVGKTGSGKSTLLDLLLNFITPQNGKIFFNDKNLQSLSEESITRKVLYVGQESIIFNDTIKFNLELDKKFDYEDIEKSLKLSCADEFVNKYPNGLDYLLQYKGTNISGGQKQRLNIARALLRESEVLILDESVNAVDSKIRQRIVTNLIKKYDKKILIFVTHDKDILNLVDCIVNLE